MTELDKAKKDKDISEDEHKRYATQVDESMAKHKATVERLAKTKETEIMTV